MRVAVVTTWPPHSDGVALYSAELFARVAELVDLKIIANRVEGGDFCGVYDGGAVRNVVRCWKRGGFLYPLRIFREVLRGRVDLVHLQHGWLLYGDGFSSSFVLVVLLLLRLCRLPCVVTMHTVVSRGASVRRNWLVNFLAGIAILVTSRFIVKLSSKVIVHNDLMKEVLQKDYALEVAGGKIAVVQHGVKDASVVPKRVGSDGKLRVLSLGFLRNSKGIQVLLDAFGGLLERFPEAVLVIVGGRHAHDKRDKIGDFESLSQTNLAKRVVFEGFVDENSLDELILASDVIALLSSERFYVESSGALARVAAYGKTVVCSKVPKFESELQNGEDCVMVTPDDAEELKQALLSLACDTGFRKKLGEKLGRKFEGRSWSIIAKQHYRLYEDVTET